MAAKHPEHCHLNRTCPLNYEQGRTINITVAIRDPNSNQTVRLQTFPIQIIDENEPPYNLTLSGGISIVHLSRICFFLFRATENSIPENTTVGSVVALINGTDDDFNQTLTYTTENPAFTVVDNQLILKSPLNYAERQYVPVIIRATDNGEPSTFVSEELRFSSSAEGVRCLVLDREVVHSGCDDDQSATARHHFGDDDGGFTSQRQWRATSRRSNDYHRSRCQGEFHHYLRSAQLQSLGTCSTRRHADRRQRFCRLREKIIKPSVLVVFTPR